MEFLSRVERLGLGEIVTFFESNDITLSQQDLISLEPTDLVDYFGDEKGARFNERLQLLKSGQDGKTDTPPSQVENQKPCHKLDERDADDPNLPLVHDDPRVGKAKVEELSCL